MKNLCPKVFIPFVVICIFLSCKKTNSGTPVTILSITGVNPTHGMAGSTDTITGTGFNIDPTLDTIYFNGQKGTIVSATSTQIIVVVPPSAGNGNIIVSVHGQGSVTTSEIFTSDSIPSIYILPSSIAIDSNNNLYVTSFSDPSCSIFKITQAGTFSVFMNGAMNGIYPYTLCLLANDTSQYIYASNYNAGYVSNYNTGIVKISLSGKIENYLNGDYYIGNGENYMVFDNNRNIYTASAYNDTIYKITPAGVKNIFTVNTSLSYNEGIAVDNEDNIYAVGFNTTVYKISPTQSTSVFLQQNVDINAIYADKEDTLYLAYDTAQNLVIKKIDLISGSTSSIYPSFPNPEPAGPPYIEAMVVDKDKNIYLAAFDEGIYKVTPSGVLSMIYRPY